MNNPYYLSAAGGYGKAKGYKDVVPSPKEMNSKNQWWSESGIPLTDDHFAFEGHLEVPKQDGNKSYEAAIAIQENTWVQNIENMRFQITTPVIRFSSALAEPITMHFVRDSKGDGATWEMWLTARPVLSAEMQLVPGSNSVLRMTFEDVTLSLDIYSGNSILGSKTLRNAINACMDKVFRFDTSLSGSGVLHQSMSGDAHGGSVPLPHLYFAVFDGDAVQHPDGIDTVTVDPPDMQAPLGGNVQKAVTALSYIGETPKASTLMKSTIKTITAIATNKDLKAKVESGFATAKKVVSGSAKFLTQAAPVAKTLTGLLSKAFSLLNPEKFIVKSIGLIKPGIGLLEKVAPLALLAV
jgi:hypothetical protein